MPTIPINSQTLKPRSCSVCCQLFQPNSGKHVFCSAKCKGRVQYITGYGSTENQYKRISYNWRRFLQRLLYKEARKHLSVEILLELLEEQKGKCALSGVELTCILGKGSRSFTNASIDRIVPGGTYEKGNIRLVCAIANTMKWNMSDVELRYWCSKILNYD